MNLPKSTFSIFLALTVLLAATLSCKTVQTEQQTTLFEQYYKIDPTSLMDSLRNGDTDVFIPVNEELDLLPEDQQVAVDWSQEDYLYIVNALYEGYLGRTLQDWQLYWMGFSSKCSYVQTGFQNGRFEFIKMVRNKEQETRLVRFIDVDPRGKFIYVWESEVFPSPANLEVIDLAELKISADHAFRIAELNGGEEARQSVEDTCHISLVLAHGPANKRGWKVSYTESDNISSLFNVEIDEITGEVYVP